MKPDGPLAFLWPYLRPHRARFLTSLAGLAARDAVAVAIPLLLREGITQLTARRPLESILLIAAAIATAAIAKAALHAWSRVRLMFISRDAEYTMRNHLFDHLMRLDASFYARTRTGDLMAHAVNDLNTLRMALGPGLVNLLDAFVQIPAAILIMSIIDWRLALAALLPIPFAVIHMAFIGRRIQRASDASQARFSDLSALAEQHLSGTRSVRAFCQEASETARFHPATDNYFAANRRLGKLGSANEPVIAFLMGISALIVLWYGGSRGAAGTLSFPTLVLFLTYIGLMLRPVTNLGRVISFLQRGFASLGRLRTLFAEQPLIAEPTDPKPLPNPVAGHIAFHNVSVTLSGTPILRNITLDIPPGTRLAIVGLTGSGKSTFARLIPRLVDPTTGHLTLDGGNMRHFHPRHLRTQIGYVPQQTFLFSASIAENIAWGAPSATPDEIRHAAELAGLTADIALFPNGYDTLVGERGVLLSGGQKQRVAIARAIVRRPRILILDDALSSVDSLTEHEILSHLETVLAQSTSILITNRPSSIRRADRIVVLEQGRIAEQGTHQQLLAARGAYCRLISRQAEIDAIEEDLALV